MRAHALTIASELKVGDAARHRPAPGARGEPLPRVARPQQLHLPRLPRVRPAPRERPRHLASRSPAPASASCATTGPTPARASCSRPAASRAARDSTILIITKANSRATVHRDVYLDYISIKRFDARGECVGEQRFLGLYASAAYNDTIHDIPLLDVRAAGGAAPHRPQRRQPLGQGHPPDPRDLPARRALPDEPGAARRDRDERAAPAGAPQDQALPAPRRVRSFRLVPRLPPARPLQHDRAAAHRGHPARGLRRREHRQHDARQRVDARPPALRRAYAVRRRHPRRRRGGPRAAASSTRPAPGTRTSPTRSARRGASRGRRARWRPTRRPCPRRTRRTSTSRRRSTTSTASTHSARATARPALHLYDDPASDDPRERRFKLYRRADLSLTQVLPALHAPRRRGHRRTPLRGARSRRPHAAHLRLRPVRRRADLGLRRRRPRERRP